MLYICRKIAAALCIVVLGACITSIYHVHSVDGNSSAVIGIGADLKLLVYEALSY
jgi:hypothetical protein